MGWASKLEDAVLKWSEAGSPDPRDSARRIRVTESNSKRRKPPLAILNNYGIPRPCRCAFCYYASELGRTNDGPSFKSCLHTFEKKRLAKPRASKEVLNVTQTDPFYLTVVRDSLWNSCKRFDDYVYGSSILRSFLFRKEVNAQLQDITPIVNITADIEGFLSEIDTIAERALHQRFLAPVRSEQDLGIENDAMLLLHAGLRVVDELKAAIKEFDES